LTGTGETSRRRSRLTALVSRLRDGGGAKCDSSLPFWFRPALRVQPWPNGTAGDVSVVRSLDPYYGLDEQAFKATKATDGYSA